MHVISVAIKINVKPVVKLPQVYLITTSLKRLVCLDPVDKQ